MEWSRVKISELCEILDNKRKPITKKNRIEGPYPYYGATGVLDYVEGYLFDEDLVLIGEDGAKWGAGDNSAFSIAGKTWVNNHAHVVKPNRNKILDSWLIYYLNGEDLSDFITGMTVPKLNQGKLKEIAVPLPPIPEQKRIVALLDTVFADLEQTRAKTEQNLKNSRELFDSYLQQVFSSKDDNIKSTELGEVVDVLTDYHANGSYKVLKQNVELSEQEGFAWMVRSTDFEKKFKNNKRYISEHAYNYLTKSKLFGGEIIMSKIGNAGKVYLMPATDRACSLAMNLFLIRLDGTKANNEYVYRYLNSSSGKAQIAPRLKGAATQTITKDNVRSLLIPLPSLVKQKEYILALQELEVETKALETLYLRKLDKIDELKKSILQKAFSGELTTTAN
ncbi:MAG: type I restriction enzyme S subunit [Francisellaceae bacterium]|jgi:type I restriction enzyme S subunit